MLIFVIAAVTLPRDPKPARRMGAAAAERETRAKNFAERAGGTQGCRGGEASRRFAQGRSCLAKDSTEDRRPPAAGGNNPASSGGGRGEARIARRGAGPSRERRRVRGAPEGAPEEAGGKISVV